MFTVGDAGTGLSNVELSLGNRVDDTLSTATDESRPESGTDAADGDGINLVVTATNSLGNKTNDGEIRQITVIAPGGTIDVYDPKDPSTDRNATNSVSDKVDSASLGEDDDATNGEEVRQTMAIHRPEDRRRARNDRRVRHRGRAVAPMSARPSRWPSPVTLSELAVGDASGNLHSRRMPTPRATRSRSHSAPPTPAATL